MARVSSGNLGKKILSIITALVLLAVWHFFPELAKGTVRSAPVLLERVATEVLGEELPASQEKNAPSILRDTVPPDGIPGKIVHVSDGDTADFRTEKGEEMRLRIYGVDAPENSQEFGAEARRYVISRILNQNVVVVVGNEDQYGRKVSTIYLDGSNFSLELLRGGYVWHYVAYCDDPEYSSAQKEAQRESKGLWKAGQDGGYEPTPPWQYRKEHPRK